MPGNCCRQLAFLSVRLFQLEQRWENFGIFMVGDGHIGHSGVDRWYGESLPLPRKVTTLPFLAQMCSIGVSHDTASIQTAQVL